MRFNIVILALSLLLLLGGCATQPYGNFIQNPSIVTSKVMADDVTAQIVRLYPAANTQFNLRHVAIDPFGKAVRNRTEQRAGTMPQLLNLEYAIHCERSILPGHSIKAVSHTRVVMQGSGSLRLTCYTAA